jgi:hypothetical protein
MELYGTIVFWFVGLAHDDGTLVANYFMFMFIILMALVTIHLVFNISLPLQKTEAMGKVRHRDLKCTPLRNRIFHLTFPSMCLLCVRALCP